MKLERDKANTIILRDANGEEIHPYLTVLAAIEFQEKIIPPRVPGLSTQGWDVVKHALKYGVDNAGSEYIITDVEVHVKDDGTLSEIVSVEPNEQEPVQKTPDTPEVVHEINPPDTVIAANNSTVKRAVTRR